MSLDLVQVRNLATRQRRVVGQSARAVWSGGMVDHHDIEPPAQAGVCDRCDGTAVTRRAEGRAETAGARLAAHHAQTAPLIAVHKRRGQLRRTLAMVDIAAVRAGVGPIVAAAA